jgi:hypothetical protein
MTILGGIGFAVVICCNFDTAAQNLSNSDEVTKIRLVQYVSNYGGIAGCLLLFSLASGAKRLLPFILTVLIAGFCFIGQFTTLSRSDWLAMAASLFATLVIVPIWRWKTKTAVALVATPILVLGLLGVLAIGSNITGKDVESRVRDRFISMLPGEHEDVKWHAWDGRLQASLEELQSWSGSPIIGQGFGIAEVNAVSGENFMSYRHNSWTSTLAESGLIGFSGFLVICFGQIIVGRRMIKDRLDRASILMGALGVITGVHFIVHGYCTMSFNQVRWAIPLALTFGAVMRCRAMQLTLREQYAGYLPEEPQEAGHNFPLLDEGAAFT